MPDDTLKVISERTNQIYSSRQDQLNTNILGWKGGQPYIEERLTRFPGESSYDWDGGNRRDGSTYIGRKGQAHVIPYLSRIVSKINQHVFSVSPKREGIDPNINTDISSTGQSVDDVMALVNSYYTVAGWCWIGIDAPYIAPEEQVSQLTKEQNKIRPYWTVYSPLEVVDWYIDSTGTIKWVLTEGYDYIASDPRVSPINQKFRKLWEPGLMTKYIYSAEDSDTIVSEEQFPLSLKNVVPFVLVGKPSTDPWGFDNLEGINRTILDLESCNRQNFYNSVFPQMKVPASILDTTVEKFSVTAEEAVQMIRGYAYPILMAEGDPEPGFIMPDASCIGAMREELIQLRKNLFDSTGLMLQQETRQVASADSKAWDFLDIMVVMRERANILEDAERKAVKISNSWDPEFTIWEPKYNFDFDISDFKTEMEALTMAANVSMPDEMVQFIIKRIFELIKNQGGKEIPSDEEKIILDAIKAFRGMDMTVGTDLGSMMGVSDETIV